MLRVEVRPLIRLKLNEASLKKVSNVLKPW